jgi:ATP-dependent helicase/nuclease subunit B
MAEPGHPAVFTIPPHRAFADALAAGLIAQFGGDPLGLARGIVLLPTNRAERAITDAFVRRAEGGLLLPRLVAIGDPDLDESIGAALDPIGAHDIPPAVDPLVRRMVLARLVQQVRREAGEPVDAAEATRLAAELARTLDQLIIERVDPQALTTVVGVELSHHWETSLRLLRIVLDRWPAELAHMGQIDLADRRNRLLDRLAARWTQTPPSGFVVVAGIDSTAPAVAELLRTIAHMPAGMVVLAGLDQRMGDAAWTALGPHAPDPETGRAAPSIETHPQFHLKRLLDRMGVARGEVRRWRWGGGRDARAVRTRAIGNAMLPASFTGIWERLPPAERRLTGVSAQVFATPAEEAQSIAIALRQAIETPGRTAALVTSDRGLARRVVSHLARWDIDADDSAGRALSATPSGTLLLAIADAAAERFAPATLLTLLKHPLVRRDSGRLEWLEGVRKLDRVIRGPRPAPGLEGIRAYLATGDARAREIRASAAGWWDQTAGLLAPLEAAVVDGAPLPALLAALREAATALAGDAAWSGPPGRALATLMTDLEAAATDGPVEARPESLARLLQHVMDEIAVRPPQGGHPRVFIWGLIEARLQHADLMVLGGLNEGSWPQAPSPDPWLAPRLRAELGLPGLERRIGIAAHDLAQGLGGRRVLVTRARRDARAPAIASRFWLRLEAMTGGMARAPLLCRWGQLLDRPDATVPATRPAPVPPAEARPKIISVTSVDRLKADPFAFYAAQILKLADWDRIDANPSPAWRGNAVHDVFETWMKDDGCDPATLRGRAEAMLDAAAAHPLMRALWQPRLIEAIEWISAAMEAMIDEGRRPAVAEVRGTAVVAGVTLNGRVDRIDRLRDGTLAIVDYKTGQPPSARQVAAGFAMQLGLLGLIAEHGGFEGVHGAVAAFEYWSLAAKAGKLGFVSSPVGLDKKGQGIDPAEFPGHAAHVFGEAARRWLTGDEPFVAKLHPEYAPYGEYDQLMRLDEWYGRA